MTSVLVVDDEPRIQDVVRRYLEREGYEVFVAGNGEDALRTFQSHRPSLVVLDLMLPRLDGWQVCKEIRQQSSVPIIMLTARADESDTLLGLDLGADDYMTKPFSPRELLARIRAVLRRADVGPRGVGLVVIESGPLHIDAGRHETTWFGHPVDLTAGEFRLLFALAQAHGRVLSRAQLIETAMGDDFDGFERTIDVHVKNVRHKLHLQHPGDPIETIRGVGYRLVELSDDGA